MIRLARFLLIAAVIFGLGVRIAGVHSHDDAAHHENCVLCQALLAPLGNPTTGTESSVVATVGIEPLRTGAEALPAPPPVIDGRLLRAPPSR
jgi:hypothetical protein